MPKVKEEVYKPTTLEILATKMVSDVYPQILSNMNDLEDDVVTGEFEDMIVEFKFYLSRGGLEIICKRKGTTHMYGHNSLWAMDDNKFSEMCPVLDNTAFNSEQYMNICEASLKVLENLRKRKQRVLKLIDKIDAIPTALHRSVIIEKFKKSERQN